MKAGRFQSTLGLLVTLLFYSSTAAHANARDEVMSSAFRCNRIADSRVWLDCYYGSAQPVRAQLGLSPAPESQTRLVISPPVGDEPKDTTARDQILADAAGCNRVKDDRAWLNCFYGASQPLRSDLGLLTFSTSHIAADKQITDQLTAASVHKTPAKQEGADFFSALIGLQNAPRLVSPITSYTFDAVGIFTVALTNGQVWRQLSGDTTFAKWRKSSKPYVAVLTHGAFGSYNLQVQSLPGIYKVTRIQ